MRSVLLLATTVLLVACGGGGAAEVPPAPAECRYERVALLPDSPRSAPTPTVVARYVPAPGLAGWTVESEVKRFVTHGEAQALQLRGTQDRRVVIESDVAQDEFNRIRIHGLFSSRLEVKVAINPSFESVQSVNAGPLPQVLRYDLHWTRRADEPLAGIELVFTGGGPFELFAVELVKTPIASQLPLAEDGPGIVPIQNESRRAVGLVPDCPLVGEVEVRHAGEVLRFAFGVPPETTTPSAQRSRIRLTVGEGADSLRMAVPLPDRRGWQLSMVDLTPFVGRTVPVRFELVAPGDRPVACALANVEVARPGTAPPAVVVITSDTHRADYLGVLGTVELDTPVLDDLARRGVLFEDAWSTTNVTSPSHVALMTGTHPRDTRMIANTGHLAEEAPTLAEAFAAAGWATIGVVSVRHLGPRGIGLGQGFDRMCDPVGEPWDAEDALEEFLRLLHELEGGPVFAWLHLFDAHDPYAPPAAYDKRYYPKDRNPYDPDLPAAGWEQGAFPFHLTAVRDPLFPEAQYRAEIAYLDGQLERLISDPRLQDGWFVFTSDHGEVLQTQGSWYNHASLFPATLRVPLILVGPQVPTGVRSGAMVEQTDVGRTLLDLAGLGGAEFPGRNLLLAHENEDAPRTRFGLAAGGFTASITDGRWYANLTLKANKSMLPRERETHEFELYDLDADPECSTPVQDQQPEVARRLRSEVVAWLESASAEGFASHAPVSAEELAALAALGYASDMPEVGAQRWMDPQCPCPHCARWR